LSQIFTEITGDYTSPLELIDIFSMVFSASISQNARWEHCGIWCCGL